MSVSERASRDTLRASVLDAAIELGIGNQTVARWMFDPLDEEDEEEPITAPSLKTTNSEESYQIVPSPSKRGVPHIGENGDRAEEFSYSSHRSPDSPTRNIRFGASTSSHSSHGTPNMSRTPTALGRNKLRKPRPDGYESDGGYVSDRAGQKKEKKSKKKDKDRKSGYESEGDKKKKKDLLPRDTSLDGDESDGGYLSEVTAKRKKSFFRRNKSKPNPTAEHAFIPPLPTLSPHIHPIADRFASRSNTPNTFSSVTDAIRGSVSTDILDTSRSATPIGNHQYRQESISMLTHAFKEDAQSIAGSVDWSNTFSHFPRAVKPPPPLPNGEPVPVPPSSSMPFKSLPSHSRAKTRPSPLLLSPLPSDYGHASQASPVPSEIGSITPDPKSTGAVRRGLLDAANSTPNITWKSGTSSILSPSPISVVPSTDYIVPTPNSPMVSPGGTLRPRAALVNYDIPPPSPPPLGPLPRPPPISNSPSKLGGNSSLSSPARSASPGLPSQRGRESPFPINPSSRLQQRGPEKRSDNTYLAEPSQSPPRPGYRRRPPPEIHVETASDDGHSIASHPDVESVLSVFRSEEDPEINTESDTEVDDTPGVVKSSLWSSQAFMDGDRSAESRTRFVQNVEAKYEKNGRERARGGPAIPPRSILRNGVSTRS